MPYTHGPPPSLCSIPTIVEFTDHPISAVWPETRLTLRPKVEWAMSESNISHVSSHAWTWALIVGTAFLIFEVTFSPIQGIQQSTPVQTVQAAQVQAG